MTEMKILNYKKLAIAGVRRKCGLRCFIYRAVVRKRFFGGIWPAMDAGMGCGSADKRFPRGDSERRGIGGSSGIPDAEIPDGGCHP